MKLPTYTCARVARDLAITGKVDDPLWATAEAMTLNDPVTGAPGKFRSSARLLYNENYLYLAFQCEDDYVWGTYTERDDPIYKQECVEAFICPSGRMRQYYEINVSPLNTVFDAFILNGRGEEGFAGFNSFNDYTCAGLITKISVDGEMNVKGGARGWSAEYAIPHSSIIGNDHLIPETGDTWRLNLYRIDSYEENVLDLYSWAEVGKRDFHRPWCFGTLVFG